RSGRYHDERPGGGGLCDRGRPAPAGDRGVDLVAVTATASSDDLITNSLSYYRAIRRGGVRAECRRRGGFVADKAGQSAGSQTLRRGIRLLEILAAAGRSMSIDELAETLGVHRSVAYRLLRTLEDHGLVAREPSGRIVLGAGLAALASGVSLDLQQAAQPELRTVANELGM